MHTPGSWKYDQMNAKVMATSGTICRLTDLSGETYAKPMTAKKDGRLLAAAPDLLTACEAAEPLLDLARARLAASAPEEPGYCSACSADGLCYNHQQQEKLINAIQQLRAAIAAARGTR